MTFDLAPGDREHGGRTVYAQYAIMSGQPLVLSGIALAAARQYGMNLYRRHGITCPGFWPRHRDDNQ
ncbi:hypothetical protein ACFVUS_12615 [Nocardia sp. NPDC058058]|uniref:hypothetical protein n=1 Tax=Nocardia sp. NPDC058058 TaxID=3346317 RepID=UPI0036D8BCC4